MQVQPMMRCKASLYGGPEFSLSSAAAVFLKAGHQKVRMQAIRNCCTSFFSCFAGDFAVLFLAAMFFSASLRGVAQTSSSAGDVYVTRVSASNEIAEVQPAPLANAASDAALPDAPEPQQVGQDGKALMSVSPTSKTSNLPMAPMYSRVIPAGMATPQIHKWDKVELASRNLYSATSIASIFFSAGWSHLTNGQPNYGVNSEAFGKRLGAAAIRDSTQAFISNGPLAVWFHDDPRYFALGNRYSIPKRAWYAVTRSIITRNSSDGHAVFNASLVLGQAAGTALNNLYYPESNRNFHDNLASFGGSMGGAALSFALDEFTSDLLRAIRLKQLERLTR